jgi:hypothetical protein
LKLKRRGKAIKCENILVDILTFDGFFDAKFDILKPRWLPTAARQLMPPAVLAPLSASSGRDAVLVSLARRLRDWSRNAPAIL